MGRILKPYPKFVERTLNEVSLLHNSILQNNNLTLSELSVETNIRENLIKKYISTVKVHSTKDYVVKLRK